MIRREPFGGIIYDDETGKVFSLDDFSFRTLELMFQQGLSMADAVQLLTREFNQEPDVDQMQHFVQTVTGMFSKQTLAVQRGETENIWGKDNGEFTHFIAPIIIFWIFTNKCNLRCIHCVQDSGEELDHELTVDECNRVISEFNQMGVCELSFSGGEPLARLNDLLNIGGYARDLGFKLSVATNGILATPKTSAKLAEAGFQYAQVSIEGPESLHDHVRGKGAYQQTLKGIKNLVDHNFQVMLACTISDFNKDKFGHVVELAKQLGVRGVRFVRFLPMGRGLQHLDLFSIRKEDELRVAEQLWRLKWQNMGECVLTFNKHYASYGMKVAPEVSGLDDFNWKWDCPAGRMRATIMPSGEITACPLIGSLGLSGGNVRTHSFSNLWKGGSFFSQFRKEKADCVGCSEWEICKGGCKAWSYAAHHSLGAKDPLCFKELSF